MRIGKREGVVMLLCDTFSGEKNWTLLNYIYLRSIKKTFCRKNINFSRKI